MQGCCNIKKMESWESCQGNWVGANQWERWWNKSVASWKPSEECIKVEPMVNCDTCGWQHPGEEECWPLDVARPLCSGKGGLARLCCKWQMFSNWQRDDGKVCLRNGKLDLQILSLSPPPKYLSNSFSFFHPDCHPLSVGHHNLSPKLQKHSPNWALCLQNGASKLFSTLQPSQYF